MERFPHNVQNYRLSIVTVHRDNFEGLGSTHESLSRVLPDHAVQWVLIDGASQPATTVQSEILATAGRAAHVYVSEPDRGIYHAMNKGAAAASGEYLLFLNAGDALHDRLLLTDLFDELAQIPDMLWGCYDETGRPASLRNIKPRSTRSLWWNMPTSHQAMLFRAACLGTNPYDERFEIAGDLDLVIRLVREGASVQRSNLCICVADFSGASNTRTATANRELGIVRRRHFHIPHWVSRLIGTLRGLIASIGAQGASRRSWKGRGE